MRVGSQKKLFRVHKNKLCAAGEFFDNMFNGEFLEAIQQTATLPEDNPDAFELLVEWCYTGQLPTFDKIPVKERKSACWRRIKLYCFSEKYRIVPLMDSSMDFIIQYLPTVDRLSTSWSIFAYENTSAGSQLRTLIAKHCYHAMLTSKSGRYASSEFTEMSPRDLIHDIFTQIRQQSEHVAVYMMNPVGSGNLTECQYHCHTAEGITECPYKSPTESSDVTLDPLTLLKTTTS